MDHAAIPVVAFGFLLGMKHALDVDHLAAVGTMIAGRRSRWGPLVVGIWWGLGHALSLLVLGGAIVFFGIAFPPQVSLALEFCVGAMLIALGLRVVLRLRKGGTLHLHPHEHGGRLHAHPHLHGVAAAHPRTSTAAPPVTHPGHAPTPHHGAPAARSPRTSLLVGLVHGAAGSGGLTLLLLPTMPTKALGVLYLAVFGAGSILGMSLATLLVSMPLRMVGTGERAGKIVALAAGALGLVVGAILMVETGGELLRL